MYIYEYSIGSTRDDYSRISTTQKSCVSSTFIFLSCHIFLSVEVLPTATKKQNKKDHPKLVNSTTTLTDITLNEIIYSIWRV